MESNDRSLSSNQALENILQSARELGVEMDKEEALQWLAAVSAAHAGEEGLEVDDHSGVFAHRIVLLDFDAEDLDRIRRVAAIVEIEDRENVETAISLSGSSAQSHIQTFPGDFDYFERVNLIADSREEACLLLGEVIRDKALASVRGPGYQLIEVRFGSFRHDVIREGKSLTPGSSITWSPGEIEDGQFEVMTPDGEHMTIDWEYACQDTGWCKLDWVLVDPAQPRVMKASNMLDATWEKPDGDMIPLDGFIDPYYQEVYLDAQSIPLFSKIARQMKPDALIDYVNVLEKEIIKYTGDDRANYGKAAKRMYNVFRLTGRYEAAAYVRELFDEPAALLYQVSALLDGLIDLGDKPQAIDQAVLKKQLDQLIADVVTVVEGPAEAKLVMSLLKIRDSITGLEELGDAWRGTLVAIQLDIDELVNEYFKDSLLGFTPVSNYLKSLHG